MVKKIQQTRCLHQIILTNDIIIIINHCTTHLLCQYMDVKGVIYDYQIIQINGHHIIDINTYVNKDTPFLSIKMRHDNDVLYQLVSGKLIQC